MRKRRGAENIDDMPTRYTDIAVVTSPRIMVTEEIDVEIEEVEELKPFIEGSFIFYGLLLILKGSYDCSLELKSRTSNRP